ncbi:hypothetical protein ARMGADRAFT_590220 [Armillaria gallica]|uniref:Uncharacterized protein n=1 Tax=Armillaria gallica TaxID=47427 RepID=A0A2H3E540_ARMGA|nr:hypothetical protein ARMGADRAFT_590220 [Armillaria gallica]
MSFIFGKAAGHWSFLLCSRFQCEPVKRRYCWRLLSIGPCIRTVLYGNMASITAVDAYLCGGATGLECMFLRSVCALHSLSCYFRPLSLFIDLENRQFVVMIYPGNVKLPSHSQYSHIYSCEGHNCLDRSCQRSRLHPQYTVVYGRCAVLAPNLIFRHCHICDLYPQPQTIYSSPLIFS